MRTKNRKTKILKETTNRREYKIYSTIDQDSYIMGCPFCPMWDHCNKYKHKQCRPKRIRERNWKSQRNNQWQ